VGVNLAKRLVAEGEDVVLFDVVPTSKFVKEIENKVKVVQGDLCNWFQVLDVVKNNRIDCIYHLGAIMADGAETNPQLAYMVNLNGTFHILEAARLFNVKSVIFASSQSTYGPGVSSPVNEDVAQFPTSIYGVTKVSSERLGEYYYLRFGLNFRGLRPPAIIGLGRIHGPSRYTSEMIRLPALGKPYYAYVDESTKYPIIYVKDVTQAFINLKDAKETSLTRRVYNLSGTNVTAGEEADIVRKYLPKAQIVFQPDWTLVKLLTEMSWDMDSTRARVDWGFRIEFPLEEAIKDYIDEIQAQEYCELHRKK